MPLPVWGYGMPDLIITMGLGRMITPDIDVELFEPDVPEEVIVTFTPIPDKVKFKDREANG